MWRAIGQRDSESTWATGQSLEPQGLAAERRAAWRGRRVSRRDQQGPRGPGPYGIAQVWFPGVRAAVVRPENAGVQRRVWVKLVESVGLGLRGDIVDAIEAVGLPRRKR